VSPTAEIAQRTKTPDAVHFCEQRILQAGHRRASDHERLQPPPPGRYEDEGADYESAGENSCERSEHRGRGYAGVQQKGREERTAAAQRQRVDAVVQIEQIDGVVAKEGHGRRSESIGGCDAWTDRGGSMQRLYAPSRF
jgi:hypothetical protein